MSGVLTGKEYSRLFANVTLPGGLLQEWLLIPEFVSEVSDLFANGTPVTNETILPIMEGIYSQYDPATLSRGYHVNGANFRSLHKSIRRLYRVLSQKSNQ